MREHGRAHLPRPTGGRGITTRLEGVLIRTRTAAALIAALATLVPALAAPAHAATAATPSVRITLVQYDSPGRDDLSNRSLNAEYVRITNTGRLGVALQGWRLRDASDHVYVFGRYGLAAGASVTVRTGQGTDSAIYRYQGRSAYVWNNDRDTAILRNAAGGIVDSCRWTSPGTGRISC
jgi:hypothetical protein